MYNIYWPKSHLVWNFSQFVLFSINKSKLYFLYLVRISIICLAFLFTDCRFSDGRLTYSKINRKSEKMPLITKTYLYNFDPVKPHFYIVKLAFTGVYIIFLISSQNIDCGYSLEPPRRGGSNEYPQSMFWTGIWKISEFLSEHFQFFWWWNFQYIWIGVFS